MRTVKADLHNHLRTSSRMSGLFNPTVDLIQKRLGPGGVIGLINFTDHRYEDFAQQRRDETVNLGNAIYVPEKDILIVKGQEVPTAEGHLLVLGIEEDKHLKEGRSLDDTIKEARDNNGVTIADHPFYRDGIGLALKANPVKYLGKTADGGLIDAVEIHNGEAALNLWGLFPKGANPAAYQFCAKLSWDNYLSGEIAVSDGHSLYELGKSWTSLKMPIRYEELKSSEKVVSSLREAIRNTFLNGPEDYQKRNAKLGAFVHAALLSPHIAKRIAKEKLAKFGKGL